MVWMWGCAALASSVPAEDVPAEKVAAEAPAEAAPSEPEPPPPPQVQLPRWAHPALTDPATLPQGPAPDVFRVRFDTTAGPFVVEVQREWAPLGADRFYGLVQTGLYDGMAFYRVVPGFVVQWGLSPYPAVNAAYKNASIPDDPVTSSNKVGHITFATRGPNTRTNQLYINLKDNTNLDRMGFAPFGTVVEGFDVVQRIHSGYGEGAPQGSGPNQATLGAQGDAALTKFPDLDLIRRAVLLP